MLPRFNDQEIARGEAEVQKILMDPEHLLARPDPIGGKDDVLFGRDDRCALGYEASEATRTVALAPAACHHAGCLTLFSRRSRTGFYSVFTALFIRQRKIPQTLADRQEKA